jgi:NADH-ubiquinone oxidoreductase chain 5
VTAGVYLLARFRDIFIFRFNRGYLLYLGSLTILLAGFRALWEIDIKKIIALSTLSQLGLIFFSLGLGLYGATFIHLLSHAYFKALLFITIGQIIHLSADYQDLRKIGLSFSLFPVSLRFSLIANLSLCGVPFIAGFYSKDYIYELLSLLNAYRGAIGIFLLAVSLTAIYTFRLIYILTLGPYQVSCISQSHDNDPYINSSIIIL